MTSTKAEPYFILRRNNGILESLLLLQIDDSLGFERENFMDDDEEEAASKAFRFNPRSFITNTKTIFNIIDVQRSSPMSPLGFLITHMDKIEKMEEEVTQKQFKSQFFYRWNLFSNYAESRTLYYRIRVSLAPDQIFDPISLYVPHHHRLVNKIDKADINRKNNETKNHWISRSI